MAELHQLVVRIPRDSIFEYLAGRRVLSNVPADSRLISMWIDPVGARDFLALRLEHDSFPALLDGGRLPFIRAKFRKP